MGLVWGWYGVGMGIVWVWYGDCMGMVWGFYGLISLWGGLLSHNSCPFSSPHFIDAILEREKVWTPATLKPESTLIGVASAARLSPPECVMQAQLCGVLLSSHLSR